MTVLPRPNPYVGPRSFRIGETLYGRDREVSDLLDLLIAERIVLLYSPSGAGKTSLVQAALIPKLQEEDFRVLPPMRVNTDRPAELARNGHRANRFLLSAMLSLEELLPVVAQTPLDRLAQMSLNEYLEQRPGTSDAAGSHVLIFDQFEEIITVDPTNQADRVEFFTQVGQALRDKSRWALFSMREDFIAALDPYLRYLPTRLSTTFRLDLLGTDAARAAMQGPARSAGADFTDAAARKLSDDLSRVRVQLPDGTIEEQPGPHVEPVQLQVVCYRIWEHLAPDDTCIEEDDVQSVGDVDSVLAAYYADRVKAVAQATGVAERAIRDWFDTQLITTQGIRGQVMWTAGADDALDISAIRPLIDAHIVRAETRRGATWFELSHDRLIDPVRKDNAAWREATLSAVQRQADLWNKQSRSDGLLFRDQALDDAERWAAAQADELTATERDFLEACRKARAAMLRERRNNRLIRGLAVAALIGLVLSVIGVIIATQQTRIAEASRQDAEQQKAAAEAARDEARRQSQIATYRQLGARSIARQDDQYDLALLLSLETDRIGESKSISDTFEGRNSLLSALENNPQLAGFMFGHNGAVYSVAFSPDGATLASGGADNSIILWDAASRQPLGQPLAGHTGAVRSVAFSPDGEKLASGSEDSSIILWDAASRQRLGQPLTGHTGAVRSVAFSPDGQTLASGSEDGSIILWDVASRQPLGKPLSLTEHTAWVYGVAFSPDGRILASGRSDGDIILWDVASRQPLGEPLTEHAGSVYSLAFSPDGQTLASGNGAGSVIVWDMASRQPLREPFTGHNDWVLSVAFSPDGTTLASGSYDSSINLWDVATGEQLTGALVGHTSGVNSVAFSPDGTTLASSNDGGSIVLWNVSGATPLGESLWGHSNAVNSVAFSPDGTTLASGSDDNSVILWDAASREPLGEPLAASANCSLFSTEGLVTTTITLVNSSGRAVAVSWLDYEGVEQPWFEMQPDQTYTYETYVTHPWCVRDKESHTALLAVVATQDEQTVTITGQTNAGHTDRVTSVAFTPDGTTLASGSADNTIILWDVASRTPLGPPWTGPSSTVLSLAFNPDGTTLASGSDDGSIILWDVTSRQPLDQPLTGHSSGVTSVAFSPDGQTLASGSDDKTIILWDVASRQPLGERLTNHTGSVYSLAFSPDGTTLASGSFDKSIILWDVARRQPLGEPLTGHTGEVNSVAFSPDGKTLASGSYDKSILLWDVASRQWLGAPFTGHTSSVLSVAFSPNGKTLASGSADNTIMLWNVDLESWKARACEMVGRNLTHLEWVRYFGEQGEPYHKTCEQWPEGK